MSSRSGLHPQALQDLEEIWEYIAQDNPDAADRMIEELFAAFDALASSPLWGTAVPTSRRGRCGSGRCGTT